MRVHTILLASALAVSACNRRDGDPGRAGGSPSGSAAAAASRPAPWEPVDESFRGCEGG